MCSDRKYCAPCLAQGDDKTHPNRHPEQVRNVVVMATMETFFRTRRSFCSRSEAERQKPPQAGSTESLIYLAESEELFYHKGCKFAYVGVDQTRRRPLTVLLFRNCCKRNYVSKDNGQFQKAKLRLRRLFLLRFKTHHRPTPAPLRVTSNQSNSNVSVSSLSSGLQANRRSFAEKKRRLRRSEQNRRRRDLLRV